MGYPQKAVPTREEINQMDQDERSQFSKDYYNGAFAHAGLKPKFRQKLKYKLGSAFVIIAYPLALLLLFIIVNVVVVGGQELWHVKQKHELKTLQLEMVNTKEIIDSYEVKVKDGSISDSDYTIYSKQIDLYNENVKESNNLERKIGSTWYIIPFPHDK
ncbi:hypothetical protein BSK66_22215 [Paenibacillus odorifer]|uniref:Uncharacterized protein n=1 Tax=Paenibacillus odorifer TaxID=189426 RepID=A0A1R0X071_9BACL|nr:MULTISPECIES: hypothetical protein [Paenibacillus]ETT55823.1 hypothetical protein C171_19307 [Paenibacillus sp. FSL H8-237]OMD25493.1 hypothetical protein BJP51_04395 [Paenibacillus odorifer]OME51952.1 hypothetical protein BSK66_22215 [Paenibacillus odorifer]